MNYPELQSFDPEIYDLIRAEEARQNDGLVLIPSENHTSPAVLEAMASALNDKYAEGYPGRRYYSGNAVVDKVERLVQDRAKALLGVPYVNVQPYSGSPANLAVYLAATEPGDAIMGLNLLDGGHLTHGWKFNVSARFWKSVPYHASHHGTTDLDEVRRLAHEHKPRLIWCGGTAIPRTILFAEFRKIADEVGAYLVADVSHIIGLILGSAHPSPVPYAHIITTTTHKTLRGPRGAIIAVTDEGLRKDPELGEKIDKAIIPGSQGGPHLHTIAGIGVALKEAGAPEFKKYAAQVVANAKTLAGALTEHGFKLVSGGTDNHLILIDLSETGPGGGVFFHEGLEACGLYANKNMIPGDLSSPFYPSGLRLGTPAATTRGMGEAEMKQVATWIVKVRKHLKDWQLPADKEARLAVLKDFHKSLETDPFYETMKQEVRTLCKKFPIPVCSPR